MAQTYRVRSWIGYVFRATIIVAVAILAVIGANSLLADDNDNDKSATASSPNSEQNLEPGETVGVNERLQTQTCTNLSGEYVEVPWDTYRQSFGYLIPQEQLTEMSGGSMLLIFEGEQHQEGVHDIMVVVYPDGDLGQAVGDNGLKLRDEGSFWRYETQLNSSCSGDFTTVDNLLMVFARDKRNNWVSQGMEGNPIDVWLSDGIKRFEPDQDIDLTDTQQTIADKNTEARCPKNDPLQENPLGDPQGLTEVEAQIGSADCRTLLIRGTSATLFTGARDGVRYIPAQTSIYLLPDSWGTGEIQTWLSTNYPGVTLVQ